MIFFKLNAYFLHIEHQMLPNKMLPNQIITGISEKNPSSICLWNKQKESIYLTFNKSFV